MKQEIADQFLTSPIRSVYFGGGTPSELSGEQILTIVQAVKQSFHVCRDAEWTIEMNPSSESLKWLEAVREAGFNRLSIGVQSLNDKTLAKIGRKHKAEDAIQSVMDAQGVGFDNISVDLIYGLPGQTLDDIETFIRAFSSFPSVKHFSCYSLQVEEGTRLDIEIGQGSIVLPKEDLERKMDRCVKRNLLKRGFEQYEISNFSKPGYESVHNSSYWDMTGYWGFGMGASFFGDMVRGTHTEKMEEYLSDPLHSVREAHLLSTQEAMGDMMFTGLRKTRGVRDREFKARFGKSMFIQYGKEIQSLIERGLLDREEDRIFLTTLGQDLANQVFIEFI